MKTSITPRLNYRPDSAGRRALIVQVIHNRRRSILTTPYRLRPEEFDARRGRAVATNRGKAHLTLIRDANECIEEYIRQLRAIADRLHETGKPYTVSDITGTYKLGGDNRYVEIFAEHVARELENAGRFGTARSYRSLGARGSSSRPTANGAFRSSTAVRSPPLRPTSKAGAASAIR